VKFFLDHDVPDEVGVVLHTRGHDVVRLREVLPITTPDEAVWAHVGEAGRVVISCNRAHYLALALAASEYPGLIVLVRRRTRQAECAAVLGLLQRAGETGLCNNINFA
jgi:hypothetical protein